MKAIVSNDSNNIRIELKAETNVDEVTLYAITKGYADVTALPFGIVSQVKNADTISSITVGSPSTFSATVTTVLITIDDFTGSDYQNDLLIGKTADLQFTVFTNNGSGVLLKVDDGYTFNATTGTLTMTADSYKIIIY